MPFGGLLTAGIIGAGGSIISSIFGSKAAKKASQQQVDQQNKALDFQKQVYGENKANQQPFVQAGQQSIQSLMDGLSSGKFGFGSLPDFKAPTAEEARATPGYQFTQQQGEQGITRGAAAAGGAFTGGTLKDIARFNTGLADSTYSSSFARAMQAYQTLVANQQQEYNQLAGVASLGENAAANSGNAGIQSAAQISNTYGNIGNSQSAGTIGSSNAIISGIQGATNAASTPFYLQYLQNGGSGGMSNKGQPGVKVGDSFTQSNGWYDPGGGGYTGNGTDYSGVTGVGG